ncbi:hypothetical protein RBB50_001225 [Rhinocladiella similis]
MRSFGSLSFSLAILSSLSTPIIASPAPIPQGSEADLTSTVFGVSQISDGQVQAPPATASTSSYENPFTIYTTQTNSLGVITGMPSVVTSQPSVVTSQPVSPTLPSYSGYVYANSTTSAANSSGSETTTTAGGQSTTSTGSGSASGATLVTSTRGASAGGASSASSSASPTFAQATGGAVSNKVAGAGVGLVVMGLGFSLL